MSTFGLISLLIFLVLVGGLALLHYGGNSDLPLAKVLLFLLRLEIAAQLVLALYEFPCYVVDGIVFISMGKEFLAKIMFGIIGLIVVFILGIILPRLNWRRRLEPHMPKIIFLGVVFIALFAYTELFNGAYSFDSMAEFQQTKTVFSEYDDHFWPTKYIKHTTLIDKQEQVALYPFDVTTAWGEKVLIYKGETFRAFYDDGTYEIFYYPFTLKLFDGAEPVSLSAPMPVPEELLSNSDVSGSDWSEFDAAAGAEITD